MGYWQYLPIYCLTRGRRLLHTHRLPLGPILPALLAVDARPHQHFEHLLLHALALIVKRAPGEAEEARQPIWSSVGPHNVYTEPIWSSMGPHNFYGPSGIVWG